VTEEFRIEVQRHTRRRIASALRLQLSTRYQDLLGGSYDCVDCIVLNAFFRMGYEG
jgi:hypothetical protein